MIKKYISVMLLLLSCGVLIGVTYPTHKEVDRVSNPQYFKRADAAWQGRARLIGELSNPPLEFTITFYLVAKPDEPVCTQKFSGLLTVYESDWLPAGRYNLVIKAEGYSQYKANKIELKAGNDCALNIYFGTEDYNGRPN